MIETVSRPDSPCNPTPKPPPRTHLHCRAGRPASSGVWEGRGQQGFRLLNQRGRYASELGCCLARLGLKLKPGDLSGEDVALAIMKQQAARARTPASEARNGPKRSGQGKGPRRA